MFMIFTLTPIYNITFRDDMLYAQECVHLITHNKRSYHGALHAKLRGRGSP